MRKCGVGAEAAGTEDEGKENEGEGDDAAVLRV